jgi:hypothetical protein
MVPAGRSPVTGETAIDTIREVKHIVEINAASWAACSQYDVEVAEVQVPQKSIFNVHVSVVVKTYHESP